jgi:hypothetical protein
MTNCLPVQEAPGVYLSGPHPFRWPSLQHANDATQRLEAEPVLGTTRFHPLQWRNSTNLRDIFKPVLKYLLQTHGLLTNTLDYFTLEFICR